MSEKRTILRVRYYGDTYTATDVANTSRKVSCTAGSSAAALAWARKYAPEVPVPTIREASDEEIEGLDTRISPDNRVSYWTWDVVAQAKKVTVLKASFGSHGWTAEEIGGVVDNNGRYLSTARQAFRAWLFRFAPDVSTQAIRPATDEDLEAVGAIREDGCEYCAFDVDAVAQVEEAPAPAEETPAAEPVADGRTITIVRTHQVEAHPLLERITLIPDAVAALGEVHHGDPKRLERHGELVEDWAAWVAEIREHGVIEPIRVVRRTDVESPIPLFYAVDGRHRLAAAKESDRNSIPTILVKDEEIPGIIAGTVTGRRHWTKSQRAWFAVVMNPGVATEAKVGRPAKNSAAAAEFLGKPSVVTAESLATRTGVSVRLIEQAIELYRGLEKHPQHRSRFEPSLWAGASLEHLVDGFKAIDSGKSGPGVPVERYPASNIRKAWASEQAASHNWGKLPPEVRSNYERDLRLYTENMAPDYLAWKVEIIAAVLKEKGLEV